MTKDDIDQQILWVESLLDSLLDGEIEDAVKAVEALLVLMRRNRSKHIENGTTEW